MKSSCSCSYGRVALALTFTLTFTLAVAWCLPVAAGGVTPAPPQRSVVMIKDAAMPPKAHIVPYTQFRFSQPHNPNCPTDHFHAKTNNQVTAFDGTIIPDPSVFGCGYGKASQLAGFREYEFDIGDSDHDGIPDILEPGQETNPDSNGNGIPDGQEDPDGDGLRTAYELLVSKTDPAVRDTGNTGRSDGTTAVLTKNQRKFTHVPLLINLYQNSGATATHMKDAVKVANKILKQVGVILQVRGIKTDQTAGDTGAGGGVAGDGKFNDAEVKLVQIAGVNELTQGAQPGGMKLSTSSELVLSGLGPGQLSPGASGHRYPAFVCLQRGTPELTGSTIAHEFLHTATLAGHPATGSPEDTPGNIMTPADRGRDEFVVSPDPDKGCENLTLTDAQKAKIKRDKIPQLFGRNSSRRSPAQKDDYGKALALDATGDQAAGQPAWLDLDMVAASTTELLEGDNVLHLVLAVNDRFPETANFEAVFQIGFDTDNNSGTGVTFNGLAGVDRQIFAYVRRLEGAGSRYAAGEVVEVGVSSEDPLIPIPLVHPLQRMADTGEVPNFHRDDVIELFLPREDLGLTGSTVPMVITSHQGDFEVAADTLFFSYDRQASINDPTLSVPVEYTVAGRVLDYAIEGLTPNDTYELLLDNDVVAFGTLDGNGAAVDFFSLDSELPIDFYFLTAVDSQGLFAGSGFELALFASGFESGNTGDWNAP